MNITAFFLERHLAVTWHGHRPIQKNTSKKHRFCTVWSNAPIAHFDVKLCCIQSQILISHTSRNILQKDKHTLCLDDADGGCSQCSCIFKTHTDTDIHSRKKVVSLSSMSSWGKASSLICVFVIFQQKDSQLQKGLWWNNQGAFVFLEHFWCGAVTANQTTDLL